MLHDVSKRTTVTLDDDVAARLDTTARRTGRSFRAVVNETLRAGLDARAEPQPPFRVSTFDSGPWPTDVDFDNINALIERLEGPWHR